MKILTHSELKSLPPGTSMTIIERMGEPCRGHCVLKRVSDTSICVSPPEDLNHKTLFLLTPHTFRPDPDGFAIVSDKEQTLARFRVNNTGAK